MSILSLNHLLSERAQYEPDIFILGVPDKSLKMQQHTFGELNLSANLLAAYYATVLPTRARGDAASKLTVALLAPSNYEYVVNEMALCRMGLATLFISVNNSPAAIAHLLRETGASHLILHPTYNNVVAEGLALLAPGSCETVPIADPEVYGSQARNLNPTATWAPPLTWEEEAGTFAFIVHSSGSTGFPKPIYITHAATVANSSNSFEISTFTTLPLYHNGAHAYLWRAMYSSKPIWVFPASDLPLTPSNVLLLLGMCSPSALHAVPYILKLLGDSEEGILRLSQFKLVIYGGSAMPDGLGDKLVSRGVNLLGLYGATETGQLLTSERDYAADKEWQYNRISSAFAPFCGLEGPRDDGAYELICKSGWPKLVVSNRPDGSYATKDLFVKHPTRPGLLKMVGRVDDTLVLINGEKINPVPSELTIKVFPGVSEAIVFGAARSQAGVLIVLGESVDPSSSRAELLKILTPALVAANKIAPTHAELMPEMVVFLPFGTLIPKADKASFIRAKVYAMFKSEIEAAYEHLEGNDGVADEDRTAVGTLEEMQAHMLALAGKVAGARTAIGLETDLFNAGLDSLQAGRIRNSLQRDFNFHGRKLPPNIVFEYPTVLKLAAFVCAFASGASVATLSASEQMLALVEKYRHFTVGANLRPRSSPSDAIVVLTGVTGSLGAQLLGALLARDSVKTVYALVRARDDVEAAARVEISMKERGLATGYGSRVVALASDFSQDLLGLSQDRYDEISSGVTLVLHNAWSVNFNLNISSFEPHIRGACNLIKLCLKSSSVADFYFASSVSSVMAWPGPGPVPEAVTKDTSVAQGMGYAQSKWVTEKLCEIVSETTSVRAVVLRIGQMVGSSIDGKWNETEAVSLIFKSAQTIKALPALTDNVSWLPVDSAARIILELVDLPPPSVGVSQTWHIVQPRTVPWSDVLSSFRASGLVFDTVDPKEWAHLLRTGPQDPIANPTVKLLSFYASKYDVPAASGSLRKRWPLDTTLTAAASKALREAPVTDDVLVRKFVQAWKATGFLS